MWNRIKQTYNAAASAWGPQYSYDTLPPEKVRAAAIKLPVVRSQLTAFSVEEYDRNPHYKHLVDLVSHHTIGPAPSIIGMGGVPKEDDAVEDGYDSWIRDNQIARSYREMVRQAVLTGIGIAVPIVKNKTINSVRTGYKVYGGNYLKTPVGARPEDRIINGIEYDDTWQPYKFHLCNPDDVVKSITVEQDTIEYTIDEVLFWSKGYKDGALIPLPECLSAFTVYPYIRRYVQAALESEEFKVSFPMAVELDSNVYSVTSVQKNSPPQGTFEYEPKTIPTLPVGTKLTGFPQGMSSADKEKLVRLFASTCALSIGLPANLANADSSNSNMASAQVDIQPWANSIKIDRFDMDPVLRESFMTWYSIASLKEGLLPGRLRQKYPRLYPHQYVFHDLFEHPDPNKRASARATDLVSGATTLNRMYSSQGLNPRRELEREAALRGVTVKELMAIYIANMSSKAIEIIQTNSDEANKEEDTKVASKTKD